MLVEIGHGYASGGDSVNVTIMLSHRLAVLKCRLSTLLQFVTAIYIV